MCKLSVATHYHWDTDQEATLKKQETWWNLPSCMRFAISITWIVASIFHLHINNRNSGAILIVLPSVAEKCRL